MEAPEELPNKTKLFFAHATENWDADYYAKINDDVYVNVGTSKVQLFLVIFILRNALTSIEKAS